MSPDDLKRSEPSPRECRQVPGYEFLRPIGRGSMGEVVLARQLALRREVAIKFVEMSRVADPHEQVARFRREAELMARISHPNIVTIYDFGTVDDQPYLVMEYVAGGDLRREMVPERPMAVDRTLALVRPIIRALTCLHRQGILHRDLKPENVLMHDENTPKVADFGIAVIDAALGSLTRTDQAMGTIGYVAPEQQYRLKVDGRADQYSLASIVYEMLTGHKPLGAFQPPSRLNRALLSAVDTVVMRGLSEDRDDRYATIEEFGDALDRALTGGGTRARDRLRWRWVAVGGVLLAAVAGLMIGSSGRQARPAHVRTELPLARPSGTPPGPVPRPAELVVNSLGMTLIPVPAGEFLMGSPDTDPEARPNEKPRHRVVITRPFYLGAHEVTVGQFRTFVEKTGYKTDAETDGNGGAIYDSDLEQNINDPKLNWRQPGYPRPQGDDEPVVQVSWNDARAFCEWLSDREKRRYRLPTEAEWEYACRAGSTTRWASGDSPEELESLAWTPNSGSPTTHRVGSKAPNAFGLFDMHGNVWEWCLDPYDVYPSGPVTDPKGPPDGKARVLRGGAWDRKKIRRTTSAYRYDSKPTARFYTYGFRVCQPLDP
jgi:formylglycine-generating enzyme required for sulfatase activity